MTTKWYSMPTFNRWIKNYFGVLIILGFVYRQKIRILVYGGLVAGIYLFFVPIAQFYIVSREELAYAAEMNDLELECNFRYACKMGYNLDCDGGVGQWPPLWGEETEEQKIYRLQKKLQAEEYYQRSLLIDKMCSEKNLWPE